MRPTPQNLPFPFHFSSHTIIFNCFGNIMIVLKDMSDILVAVGNCVYQHEYTKPVG